MYSIAFAAIAAFLVGVIAGGLGSYRAIVRLRRRVRALRSGTEQKKTETTKKIIWICLANGFVWVWCSYILAYLDKPQIAESLSQVAVTEIIGVVLAYCVKSAIENLSKNNKWPDKDNSEKAETVSVEDPKGLG